MWDSSLFLKDTYLGINVSCLPLARETCSFIPLSLHLFWKRMRRGRTKPNAYIWEKSGNNQDFFVLVFKKFLWCSNYRNRTFTSPRTHVQRNTNWTQWGSAFSHVYMYIKTTKRPWIWEGVGRDTGGAGGRGKGGNDRNIALTYKILKIFIYQNIKIIKNVINHLQLIK